MSAPAPASDLPSTSAPAHARPHVAWPHLLLVPLGLAASAWAIQVHNRVKAGEGCGIGGFSCDKVIGSSWGELFGIPVGYFGIVFWLIVAITAFSSAGVSRQSAALQRLGVGVVGFGSSVVFAGIAHFVIKEFCPVCATTHVLTTLNFLVAAVLWWRVRNKAT